MIASNFSLSHYLKRINYNGEVRPDLITLIALMQSQLRTVPFENTEVQAERIPSMVQEDIYTKIVTNKRGGYCYEVNGLFAMALTAIGFQWYFVGARPMFYPTRRPKTHMIIAVTINDDTYVCDTGFGGYGLRAPLKLVDNTEIQQDDETFKLQFIDGEYVLNALVNSEWTPQYGFSLTPQEWIEFSLANYFNATSPDVIFTQKKLAVMQTATGRKILVDNLLKIIDHGVTTQYEVDYNTAALEYYNLSNVASSSY